MRNMGELDGCYGVSSILKMCLKFNVHGATITDNVASNTLILIENHAFYCKMLRAYFGNGDKLTIRIRQ